MNSLYPYPPELGDHGLQERLAVGDHGAAWCGLSTRPEGHPKVGGLWCGLSAMQSCEAIILMGSQRWVRRRV